MPSVYNEFSIIIVETEIITLPSMILVCDV